MSETEADQGPGRRSANGPLWVLCAVVVLGANVLALWLLASSRGETPGGPQVVGKDVIEYIRTLPWSRQLVVYGLLGLRGIGYFAGLALWLGVLFSRSVRRWLGRCDARRRP